MKLPALALTLLAAACSSLPKSESNALIAADRAFARDVAERRLEAWINAFDEHGAQVGQDFAPITGHDAIRAYMSEFFADPRNELEWTPDSARISEGGRLGATSGRFCMLRKKDDGSREVVMTGRYFDVWRKLDDGTWKLLYDIGDHDAPAR